MGQSAAQDVVAAVHGPVTPARGALLGAVKYVAGKIIGVNGHTNKAAFFQDKWWYRHGWDRSRSYPDERTCKKA